MLDKKISDQGLWESIQLDDETAFKELFNRYWSKVYATAYSLLQDKELCEEITHDIFINIWMKRKQLQISSILSYLTSAARYHVYRAKKTKRAYLKEYIDDENYELSLIEAEMGDDKLRYTELEKILEIHLENLPKRCKEIFILSRKNHFSNDEISLKLGISKRTVENQITYALKYLRINFKDIYVFIALCSGV